VGRGPRRSLVRPPAPAAAALGSDPLAQGFIHSDPANLQGRKWCDISGQAAPLLDCPHGGECFFLLSTLDHSSFGRSV